MERPRGAELFASAARRLRADFDSIRAGITHPGERGRETQEALIHFLNGHLPKRFRATSGFIIDSTGAQSRHLDVIIFDQVDALVFSPADNTLIVPNDNVAAVIEVKSTLDKAELNSAADQIAHAKALTKLPPLETDYPTANTRIQLTGTRGIVFAYTASTSLRTLSSNLREINARTDSSFWIDDLVVLDAGWISYSMQIPDSHATMHFGGLASPSAIIFPTYVMPILWEVPDAILSSLMFSLGHHLAHYRRRPAPVSDLMLSPDLPRESVGSYWLDTEGKLQEVPPSYIGSPTSGPPKPAQRIVFSLSNGTTIGQVEWRPWADGHFFSFRVSDLPVPDLVVHSCLEPYGIKIQSLEPVPGLKITQLLPGPQPPDFARVFAHLSQKQMPWRAELLEFRDQHP